jgi:hypothetical protein
MELLTEVRWTPYAVGIGILSWFSFLISRNRLVVLHHLREQVVRLKVFFGIKRWN